MNTLVSVILPFYNAEKTLKAAALSILNQEYSNIQLILVNNGSTDESATIAESLCRQDSRVVAVSENTRGVVYAFNKGLACAKGEFIARMDADDISYPNRIGCQLAYMHGHPKCGLVGSQVAFSSTLTRHEGIEVFIRWSNAILDYDDIFKNRFVELPVVNPTFMIRRSVIDRYGSYRNGDFPEDYEFFLRLLSHGVRIAKIDKELLQWNDHPSRLTRTDERYSHEAFFRVKAPYLLAFIKQSKGADMPVWIWGAGKLAKRDAKLLSEQGLRITGYIDIDKKKTSTSCIHYLDIKKELHPFVLSLVSNRNKGEEIRQFLESRDYQETKDFIIAG